MPGLISPKLVESKNWKPQKNLSKNWLRIIELTQESPRMQPTLPQAAGTADMDLTAVQSINDWFFKKEQIYLLAQFWQQVRKVSKTMENGA